MVQKTDVIQYNADIDQALLRIEHALGKRLLERLEFIKFSPLQILVIGEETEYFCAQLKQKYPNANVVNMTLADAKKTLFDTQSIDFIFSSCILHRSVYPLDELAIVKSMLKPGGLLLLASVGPDTFQELKVDTQFIDMHEYGDMLLHLGLESPVMDREVLNFNYTEDLLVTVEALYGVAWCAKRERNQRSIDFVYHNEE